MNREKFREMRHAKSHNLGSGSTLPQETIQQLRISYGLDAYYRSGQKGPLLEIGRGFLTERDLLEILQEMAEMREEP